MGWMLAVLLPLPWQTSVCVVRYAAEMCAYTYEDACERMQHGVKCALGFRIPVRSVDQIRIIIVALCVVEVRNG